MWPSAGQMRFPDADGTKDQSAVRSVGEPQRDQFVPQLLVVADCGGAVPGVEPQGRVEPCGPGAERRGLGFATADLVGKDELQEVGVR